MDHPILLPSLFFLTALIYSMAGFAGGSTYLALLALFSFPYESIPKVALLCNLIVSTGGTWLFFRAGHLSFRRILPFVVTSIPMAYLGGATPIGKTLFTWLLGLSLMVAALRMLLADKVFESREILSWKTAWVVGIPVGALLGFLSGLVGIGGGIYLAPVLLLMGWANSKQAAASASFFILVNSLSGLAGQLTKGGFTLAAESFLPLLIAVFLGGQIGSRLGSQRLPKVILQRLAAGLILFVSGRLLWGVL